MVIEMGKPYVKKIHVIIEIVSFILVLAAFIYVIGFGATVNEPIATNWSKGQITGYGSPYAMLCMPIIMLVTNIIMVACVHLLPAKSFNLPVKPKPGRELILLADSVWMIVLLELVMALYSLATVIVWSKQQGSWIGIVTWIMLAGMFIVIGGCFWKCVKDNR